MAPAPIKVYLTADEELNNWVADDQVITHDDAEWGVGADTVPKFWVNVYGRKMGIDRGYGWLPVKYGIEEDPSTWVTAMERRWFYRLGELYTDMPRVEERAFSRIRGRKGTPREGWTYDYFAQMATPPGAQPASAEDSAPPVRPAPPPSEFAKQYATKAKEAKAGKLADYASTKALIETAVAQAQKRKLGTYEASRTAAEARAAAARERTAEVERQIAALEAKMNTDPTVLGVEEPEYLIVGELSEMAKHRDDFVTEAQVEVGGVTPKFWVWSNSGYYGDPYIWWGWLGVVDGDERDQNTWTMLRNAAGEVGGPARDDMRIYYAVRDQKVPRGRKGSKREGWTLDTSHPNLRLVPPQAAPPAQPGTPGTPGEPAIPRVRPAPPPSEFAKQYAEASREARRGAATEYQQERQMLQDVIKDARRRELAARLGVTLAGEAAALASEDEVGRMSYGMDESEFDQWPYANAFRDTSMAVRVEGDMPDVFSSPPKSNFPRFREEIAKFRSDEPIIGALRIDSDATYVPGNADAKIAVPIGDGQGCIRCWREGDDICCSMRFAAPDGSARIATAAARQPSVYAAAVADALEQAGLNDVDMLGVIEDARNATVGERLIRDLAGAVLALSHRSDVMGALPAVVKRNGGDDAAVLAAMSLLQQADAGDEAAMAEVEQLDAASRQPVGQPVAAMMASARTKLAAARRKPGLIARILNWIGVSR